MELGKTIFRIYHDEDSGKIEIGYLNLPLSFYDPVFVTAKTIQVGQDLLAFVPRESGAPLQVNRISNLLGEIMVHEEREVPRSQPLSKFSLTARDETEVLMTGGSSNKVTSSMAYMFDLRQDTWR
mmetsp:Transcript_27353/g.36586  ORF Transcript_27353/g.36586 Transcript_27353/m.36586 type:complete len:125 (+) Transcript_27353:770-1144(+)